MKLSLVLFLTLAFCVVSLFPSGLGLSIHLRWKAVLSEDPKQPPAVAKSVAAEWPGSIGLRSPRRWFSFRMGVSPEGRKQPPVVAESVAAEWPGSIALRSLCRWFSFRMGVVPESPKQPPVVAESVAAEWPGSIALRSLRRWFSFRMGVVPESPKQPPVVAESFAAEWPGSIGLRSPRRWSRFRMGVVPEGPKQPPVVTKSTASDLPYPLGQLWDYLARVDMISLLRWAGQTVWLLLLSWIALDLFSDVERPQGQERGRTASSSMGTDCCKKGTCSHYDLLCRLEANTTLLLRWLRRVYRLHRKELRHRHSKVEAQQKGKKRRVISSSVTSTPRWRCKTKARRGEPSLAPRAAPVLA